MDRASSHIERHAAAHQAHLDADADFEIVSESLRSEKYDAVDAVFKGGTFDCLGWNNDVKDHTICEWNLKDVYEWTSGYGNVDSALYSLLAATTPEEAFTRLQKMQGEMVEQFLRFKEDDIEVTL